MSLRARLLGVCGVVAIAVVVVGGGLVTWTNYQAPPSTTPLAVFDVAPPAAPAEPVREVKPGLKQDRKERRQPETNHPPMEQRLMPMPVANLAPAMTTQPVSEPNPPITETTAPEVKPAPPAPQPSDAAPTWQGQVLAALNKVHRYPRDASLRRQQGVPYVRFVMDREGKVLTSRLERSSGIRSLDSEAIGLPKRAQPLPKPPEDIKGDTIELVVPVEFFMR